MPGDSRLARKPVTEPGLNGLRESVILPPILHQLVVIGISKQEAHVRTLCGLLPFVVQILVPHNNPEGALDQLSGDFSE